MWKRLLLLIEPGRAEETLVFARRLAPAAERITGVLLVPELEGLFGRSEAAVIPSAEREAQEVLLRMRALFGAAAGDIEFVPRISAVDLADSLASERAEALLVGRPPAAREESAIALVEEVCALARVPAIWAPGALPSRPLLPIRELLLPGVAPYLELRAVAALLRDHTTSEQRVTLLALGPGPLHEEDVAQVLQLAGVHARSGLVFPAASDDAPHAIARAAAELDAELILVGPTSHRTLHALLASTPKALLVAPRPASASSPLAARLEASDALAVGGQPRARLELVPMLGPARALPDQPIVLVADGREVARVVSRGGLIPLPPEALAGAAPFGRIGVGRPAGGDELLTSVETSISLLHAGPAPITLVDARLSSEAWSLLSRSLGGDVGRVFVVVRVRPEVGLAPLRAQLAGLNLPHFHLLDAAALLDDGASEDVPGAVDPVRLCRLAARLRLLQLDVDSAVHPGLMPVDGHGFAVFAEGELGREANRIDERGVLARVAACRTALRRGSSIDARLDGCTASCRLEGNHIQLELRNDVARRSLLDAIGSAKERIHLQTYIARDDGVSEQIEAALTAAAARGVSVRVLADSLYSLHGSFGAENPLLTRLSKRPGLQVRASHPVARLPTVEDLKQRDHRKIVVIDGVRASVGGRNLAREYLLDFAEVKLRTDSSSSDIPWLDAGAWVQGPVVAELERSFSEAWTDAGGDFFSIPETPAAGASAARIVIHRGLRDARTLEVYLALIDSARQSLDVVNTFPIQLELQHALLSAVARGVRVRALFGNPRPLYGDVAFQGSGPLREVANQLVRARIDALVDAGGEAYELALRDVPGWAPALGVVRPHVHAKVVCADRSMCAVGSANLDITASYWESEALLVIEDPEVARSLATQLEPLFESALRVDRTDPHWTELTARRARLSRWWPSMIG